MATSDSRGGPADRVELTFDGNEFHLAKNYEVASGIFTQPSAFNVEFGPVLDDAENEIPVTKFLPPNAPFTLSVGGNLQFEGTLDAIGDHGNENASATKIRGRDALAPLHDGMVENDQTLEDKSPLEILNIGLTAVGLAGATVAFSNNSGRQTRAGVPVRVIAETPPTTTGRPKRRRRAAKCGETWYTAISREFQHAGLFLWGAPGPTFVLASPNASQAPLYSIVRKRAGQNANGRTLWTGNVKSYDFELDTTHRFSKCRVYGSGGGKEFGNVLATGVFDDPEMVGWGFSRLRTVKDVHAQSNEEAQFYAQRKLAESRRAGYRHSYVVAGHTTTSSYSPQPTVWTPDTMVHVDDDKLAITGDFWIENVLFRNNDSEGTTTTIRLLRAEDLIFGADDEADG